MFVPDADHKQFLTAILLKIPYASHAPSSHDTYDICAGHQGMLLLERYAIALSRKYVLNVRGNGELSIGGAAENTFYRPFTDATINCFTFP